MGQKGVVFTTSLSVKECANVLPRRGRREPRREGKVLGNGG